MPSLRSSLVPVDAARYGAGQMPVQPAPVPPIPTPLPSHLVPSTVMISSMPALGTDVDGITRQFYPNSNPTRRLVVPGSQAGTATNTVQVSTPQAMGLTQGVYSSPQITVDNKGNITLVKNVAQASGSLAAQNGYVYLANGILLQWGYTNPTNVTVSFPIPFPRQCFVVTATAETMGSYVDAPVVSGFTTTSFYLRTKSSTSGAATGFACYWMALGN